MSSTLERVLADYPAGHVISTGAGTTIFNNTDYRTRAQKALSPHKFVVLLLPSPDADSSVRICTARIVAQNPEMTDHPDSPLALNASFIRRRDYHDMAKITIYNGDQTPEETCLAIIRQIEEAK